MLPSLVLFAGSAYNGRALESNVCMLGGGLRFPYELDGYRDRRRLCRYFRDQVDGSMYFLAGLVYFLRTYHSYTSSEPVGRRTRGVRYIPVTNQDGNQSGPPVVGSPQMAARSLLPS